MCKNLKKEEIFKQTKTKKNMKVARKNGGEGGRGEKVSERKKEQKNEMEVKGLRGETKIN